MSRNLSGASFPALFAVVCFLGGGGTAFAQITHTGPVSQVVGSPSELSEGYYTYVLADGIYVSLIKQFNAMKVPNTAPTYAGGCIYSLDISSDGKWLIYMDIPQLEYWEGSPDRSCTAYLIKPDGTGKTKVPGVPNRCGGVGFVRNGPNGDEIFYQSGTINITEDSWYESSALTGVKVNLSGSTPVFGATRTIAQFSGGTENGFWAHYERAICVSKDHLFFGAYAPRTSVIPNGGSGTATTSNPLNDHSCGENMDWDGSICICNLNEFGDHKGPSLFRFKASGFLAESDKVSKCKAPDEYSVAGHDWHYWHFSNNPEWVTGVNQGAGRNFEYTDFTLSDANNATPGWGMWILKWNTGRWIPIGPTGLRSKWVSAFFSPDGKRESLPPPLGNSTALLPHEDRTMAVVGTERQGPQTILWVTPGVERTGLRVFQLDGRTGLRPAVRQASANGVFAPGILFTE